MTGTAKYYSTQPNQPIKVSNTQSISLNVTCSENQTAEIYTDYFIEETSSSSTDLETTPDYTTLTTTTLSNPPLNLAGQIQAFFLAFFGDIQFVLDLLSTATYDLSGCLQSCSFQGFCLFNPVNSHYECNCIDFITGTACSSDTRPCSSSPCLNGGSCTDFSSSQTQLNISTTEYICSCTYLYYGDNCENKINICQNITCSGNGFCKDLGNATKCICKKYFSGDNCEIEASDLKTVKAVISTATVVAYVIFGMSILMVLFCDFTSYLTGKFDVNNKRSPRRNSFSLDKPIYVNWPNEN